MTAYKVSCECIGIERTNGTNTNSKIGKILIGTDYFEALFVYSLMSNLQSLLMLVTVYCLMANRALPKPVLY